MKTTIILLAALCCVVGSTFSYAENSARLSVTPQNLDIGAFYNGTAVTATGTIPADSHAVLRFMGASCDLHMKKKGKVFGLMWMNLDSLIFKGVPSVCIVSSALNFSFKDLARAAGAKGAEVANLSLSGIKDQARIEPDDGNQAQAFQEFIRLKSNEGLYGETVGNVTYGEAIDGHKSFRAEIPIPSRLVAGSYQVELSVINGGEIVGRAEQPVTVKLVGFPALLANLAFDHAALYGILATVIAILSGLAIGMIFDSKGGH